MKDNTEESLLKILQEYLDDRVKANHLRVIEFPKPAPKPTREDQVEKCLEDTKEAHLQNVFIVGEDDEGATFFTGNMTVADAIYFMEKVKFLMIQYNMIGPDDEE